MSPAVRGWDIPCRITRYDEWDNAAEDQSETSQPKAGSSLNRFRGRRLIGNGVRAIKIDRKSEDANEYHYDIKHLSSWHAPHRYRVFTKKIYGYPQQGVQDNKYCC